MIFPLRTLRISNHLHSKFALSRRNFGKFAAGAGLATALGVPTASLADTTLLNVSYDPTCELY